MKHTFITALLALGLIPAASAANKLPYPDVPAAAKAAQAQNKPQLIIWYGSDWMPKGAELCAEWNKLSSMDLPVILGQYDDCLGQPGDTRNKTLPIECYSLPIAVLMDAEGNFVAKFEGKTVRSADKLAAAVNKLLPKVPEFTKLLKAAESHSGPEAAIAAGKALDLLPMASALSHKKLKTIIDKQDPEDTTGYRSVYAMDHMAMFKEINLRLQGGKDGQLKGAERDFAAAEAYVNKTLKNKKLKDERRQQWLAGLYYIQKERGTANGKRDVKDALATLKAITAISTKTQTGKGAARYFKYWDENSYYTITGGFYTSAHHTLGFEKEWHVDVTSSMDGPGTYTFSLIPRQNGPVVTRDFRLVINGKEAGKPAGVAPDANVKSVEFSVPSYPKGAKVEVWLRARNNSGWLDGTGVLEMKKK